MAFAAVVLAPASLHAQVADRVPDRVDSGKLVPLAGHQPQWASAANSLRPLAASQAVHGLTLVLERSPEQETAFTKLLAAQQDPTSPEYHHWLTPAQVGERFGLSAHDVASVSAWLQAQGLHVTYVAPSRIFIGFSGTAAQIGSAFHTALRLYKVHETERMSVDSDPMLPASLAPVVKSIRGLYEIDEHPYHGAKSIRMATPELTASNGAHFITPADFATIYDLPVGGTGTGQTIGVVGESRTNFADFEEFEQLTGTTFANPVEIVPTAFGGVDPGPAYTAPPPSGTSIGNQTEATLDVMRAGSVANGAQIDLVVATPESGGIGDDAQYLVQTTPLPAQVMSISFGGCESEAGASGVAFWDTLFQQAASQGISVFVSSGDAGASGCDANFATPPANPPPNSPNFICSSSYATCVGGTEFNDTGDPTLYWSASNSSVFESALSYIPEGAWNQPLNEDSEPQAASSGGGVSSIIATPSWQTGTGVPTARAGRYTPDIAFSASGHDGYFGCYAAAGASCVPNSQGEFEFEYFYGTSAAAPSMAGIAAILDANAGAGQGNLNPGLYSLAANTPAAFHDVTVTSSGVSGCTVDTPSMCNNSIPGPTGLTGGQAGYLVDDGYDEVTGLGSLDISNFLTSYSIAKVTPTVTLSFSPPSITTAQPLGVVVELTGKSGDLPTGSVILSGGGYKSTSVVLSNGNADFTIPAGSLPVGQDTLTASYTPDTAGAASYNAATGSNTITVTSVPIITPNVSVLLTTQSITTAQPLSVEISIGGGLNNAVPTGTVKLSGGGYASAAVSAGSAGLTFITIPAQALAVGTDTLTSTYAPDAASAKIYSTATGSAMVTVTTVPKTAPIIGVTLSSSTITTAQALSVSVDVDSGAGNQTPTGTATVTSGSFSSSAVKLSSGMAAINIPAGTLPAGVDPLTVSYTPDSGSSAIYLSATGMSSVTVTAAVPASFSIAGAAVSVKPGATTGNTSTVTVTPAGGFTGTVTLTASVTSSPTGAVAPPTLSFGSTGSVVISGTANGTATLTVSTTDGTVCGVPDERIASRKSVRWFATGGVALASFLMLGFPAVRRRRLFPALLLLAAAASAITACGGGGGKASCNVATPGTTAGTYTITVTGASGSTTSTGTVTLTVQ